MPARGVFVDDEHKQYASLLSTNGVLEFTFQAVSELTDQAMEIKAVGPTVVALDYRLDEVTPGVRAGHTYKGSGLAQILRDGAIGKPEEDFAIVLVSNEVKLEAFYAPDKTAHDLFDMVYSKEFVTQSRDRVRAELRALSAAYLYLRDLKQNYPPMVILNAGEAERDQILTQEITASFSIASAPHIVSKYVLRNIIERPGLLLNDADAAAALGIEVASFEQLVPHLAEIGLDYRGIFSDGWPRWWAGRIEDWGAGIVGTSLFSLTAQQRAERFSAHFGISLQPAPSPWNGSLTEVISFACASCNRPTELRRSLAAFEAKVPRYAKRRRICWDCIQTDRYLEEPHAYLIEESDEPLVADIKIRDRKA